MIKGNVFYCDPYVSNQKGRLEKNHEYIRYVIPKGRSMYRYTQDDINLMTSHINSTARDSLNCATPFDLAALLPGKQTWYQINLIISCHKLNNKIYLWELYLIVIHVISCLFFAYTFVYRSVYCLRKAHFLPAVGSDSVRVKHIVFEYRAGV